MKRKTSISQIIILQTLGLLLPLTNATAADAAPPTAATEKPVGPTAWKPDLNWQKKLTDSRVGLVKAAVAADWLRGMRAVELIRSDVLSVTLDAGLTDAIAPKMFRIGADVRYQADVLARYDDPATFTVSSPTDPDYKTPVRPAGVGQYTYEGRNGAGGGKDLPSCTIFYSDCFLFLPKPMKSGHSYTVIVSPSSERSPQVHTSMTFDYNEARTTTKVIKINQVAYSSQAKQRFAYLGWWAGNKGKVDYTALKGFEVVDRKTGKVTLTGELKLRAANEKRSGEDIYELDIAPLGVGEYQIRIPGLGCSDHFTVGGAGIQALYYHSVRGYFYQRCGQEFKEPWTWVKKPACHSEVLASGLMPQGSPTVIRRAAGGSLQKTGEPAAGEKPRHFQGGYHDAADFDVFSYNLPASAMLMAAYEIFPEAFADRDLDIPESGNGIPDILDEAEWGVSGHLNIQNSDGSVPLGRGNLEDGFEQNIEGGDSPFDDHDGVIPAYGIIPPRRQSTATFAAVAANFARVIKPFDKAKSERYAAAAEKAFAYATSHTAMQTWEEYSKQVPGLKKPEKEDDDPGIRAWAAAELLRLNGKMEYADYVNKQSKNLLSMMNARFADERAWALANADGIDAGIRKRASDELKSLGVRDTFNNPYRMSFSHWDKLEGFWGAMQGVNTAGILVRGYALGKDQKLLDALSLNADWHLGCNPRSQTFMTNMGYRFPKRPEISYFLYERPDEDLSGVTVKGISLYGVGQALTDRWGKWPAHRSWRDVWADGAELYSEFTISGTQEHAAMAYAALYALEKKAGTIPANSKPNPLDR